MENEGMTLQTKYKLNISKTTAVLFPEKLGFLDNQVFLLKT